MKFSVYLNRRVFIMRVLFLVTMILDCVHILYVKIDFRSKLLSVGYEGLTIFTLTKWWTGYTLQNSNRANSSDIEAPFWDLNLCISNGTVSTKMYDKRDDFDFDIVNFPFLDGDVPRRTSYGVYISQLIRFARASSNLSDFNYRNKALTAKLLRQGYRYFKLRKAFSKFYRRLSALVEKYRVSLKTLLQQGIPEPEFYGDLVYRFRKIVGKSFWNNSANRYKRFGYSLDIMRQTACIVVNPIIVNGYASLFNCTTAVRASYSMTALS